MPPLGSRHSTAHPARGLCPVFSIGRKTVSLKGSPSIGLTLAPKGASSDAGTIGRTIASLTRSILYRFSFFGFPVFSLLPSGSSRPLTSSDIGPTVDSGDMMKASRIFRMCAFFGRQPSLMAVLVFFLLPLGIPSIVNAGGGRT